MYNYSINVKFVRKSGMQLIFVYEIQKLIQVKTNYNNTQLVYQLLPT